MASLPRPPDADPTVIVRLAAHPTTPAPFLCTIVVDLRRDADGNLALTYDIQAPPMRLHFPEPASTERADGLWRHTCCELFVAQAHGAYREFNLSPSGLWQTYDFSAYRQAALLPDARPPALRFTVGASGASLAARIDADQLPGGALRLGVATVLEDRHGGLSYWAAHHPAERPDFHHPDAFTLELP